MFVLVNAPRHGPFDWDQPKAGELYARHLLDLMAARGVDLRDRVLFCETRTPADLQRATGAPGGAIYGASSHGTISAFRRAANRSPVPGLFLTGGSAHPGGGLPLVALSAAAVARLMQQEVGWDDARRLAEVDDYLAHVSQDRQALESARAVR